MLKRLLFSIKISKTPKFKDELKKRLKEDYGCTSYDDCEFPYPFYLNYLNKRGLKHLKELAIWSNKGSFKRSKTFINILKIRLKFYFPDKYGTITRNEAHVRLASSTWYVSRISFFIGLFGFVISIILCYFQNDSKLDANIMKVSSKNLASLISPLIIILSSGYLKHNISKFIHYQRLREVFYVLETSFTTFRNEKFMQIIDPPFNLK